LSRNDLCAGLAWLCDFPLFIFLYLIYVDERLVEVYGHVWVPVLGEGGQPFDHSLLPALGIFEGQLASIAGVGAKRGVRVVVLPEFLGHRQRHALATAPMLPAFLLVALLVILQVALRNTGGGFDCIGVRKRAGFLQCDLGVGLEIDALGQVILLLKITEFESEAAWEYQRNRLEVISKQREAYNEIERAFAETPKKLESALGAYNKHPLINIEALLGPIRTAFETQARELGKVREQHPDLVEEDQVREILTKLLENKVGSPYPAEQLSQLCKEGADRYSKQVPPGFLDEKKEGDRKFGDFILWRQVLDKAKEGKSPVIIVTDDAKEDWWWKHQGKIIGPRPELVEEMRATANVSFYMYRSDQFLEHAARYLKQHVDQTAIAEVREIRNRDEEIRRRLQRSRAIESYRMRKLAEQRGMATAELAQVVSKISELEHDLNDAYTLGVSDKPHEVEHIILAIESQLHGALARRTELEKTISELDHDLVRVSLARRTFRPDVAQLPMPVPVEAPRIRKSSDPLPPSKFRRKLLDDSAEN
jgi:hypothetical protein